jgi:hypothetical protein
MVHFTADPFIDVYVFHRDSSNALLNATNPYGITFPDIYWPKSDYYGPGISVNGRLQFGYPYLPLSLFMAFPAHVLGGDARYSQAVAVALAALLMGYAKPGRRAFLAAGLFLFTPRFLHVEEASWTEPFVVLLLAGVVFCACRFPRFMPFVLGLLLAVKQYMFLAIPLTVLLLPRPLKWKDLWNLWWKAATVALVVSLPLILGNFKGFMHSAVTLQFQQPFRDDALSYLAGWKQFTGKQLPAGMSFLAALAAIGICLWKAPRSAGGFAAAMALTFMAFFAFNKQAFCNYYYFVIGAMCCAVAVGENTSWTKRNCTSEAQTNRPTREPGGG